MNCYLFILCPPYSGSTILWQLVSTSPNVSSLPGEGQFLAEVKEIMRADPWNPELKLPWPMIKEVWESYWDHSKPLLLEKSPPNIIRVKEIAQIFDPSSFIIMVRNPYAHSEGLMRRKGWNSRRAAEFSMNCLRVEAENAGYLPRNIHFTYEEFTGNTQEVCNKIQSFLPAIGELNYEKNFKAHSIVGSAERKLVNLNQKKINNLKQSDILRMNEVFEANQDVMKFWGYEFYRPAKNHNLTYLMEKTQLLKKTKLYKKGYKVTEKLFRSPKKDNG